MFRFRFKYNITFYNKTEKGERTQKSNNRRSNANKEGNNILTCGELI